MQQDTTQAETTFSRRLSVAPMMDWTDRFCRYFHRLLSCHTLLYTEMVTTGALMHGDVERHLRYNAAEHPVALQLGGNDPAALAHCAGLATEWGYDEVNLNVGCPSDRVQNGQFGACLMGEPGVVAAGVAAMQAATHLPVTVKTRIGIDRQENYEFLQHFVEIVAGAGCETFIIHARKAWLDGLSPKENRTIPPLRYDVVYQLKQDFPQLEIIINGGIETHAQIAEHLAHVDGVMIGRAAYGNPGLLLEADQRYYGVETPPVTAHAALEAYIPFAEQCLAEGVPLGSLTKPLLGLFQGQRGAKAFRRHLSENAHKEGVGVEIILEAAAKVAAS